MSHERVLRLYFGLSLEGMIKKEHVRQIRQSKIFMCPSVTFDQDLGGLEYPGRFVYPSLSDEGTVANLTRRQARSQGNQSSHRRSHMGKEWPQAG